MERSSLTVPSSPEGLWPNIQLLLEVPQHLLGWRFALPVITYKGIDGLEMEDNRGEPVPGWGGPTMTSPPWYIRILEGWHVKNKGKPSIDILFDEGAPTHLRNVHRRSNITR